MGTVYDRDSSHKRPFVRIEFQAPPTPRTRAVRAGYQIRTANRPGAPAHPGTRALSVTAPRPAPSRPPGATGTPGCQTGRAGASIKADPRPVGLRLVVQYPLSMGYAVTAPRRLHN